MQIIKLPLAALLLLSTSLWSQDLKEIRKNMKPVPAATFYMGGGYQYETAGASMLYLGQDQKFNGEDKARVKIGEVPLPNNPCHLVDIAPFSISSQEVTNQQYRDFLRHSLLNDAERKLFDSQLLALEEKENNQLVIDHWQTLFSLAEPVGIMPDVNVWDTEFPYSYNQPLAANYFWHPAFNQFPVVGVTWKQAKAYCAWLTEFNNVDRATQGLAPEPAFRLPSEAEWEFAARGITDCDFNIQAHMMTYPWPGIAVRDKKGRFQANIRTNHNLYIEDGYEYTAPIGRFGANGFGLYDMAGNVAEWTEETFEFALFPEDHPLQVEPPLDQDNGSCRVAKGGSWADFHYASQTGSRCKAPADQGSARIGFRIVQSGS